MAVTRIWPIKGRLRNVIDYTVNPEKTFNPDYTFEELQALKDVIDYAMESDKTEKQFYVTEVNCTAGFAREQMVNTKRLFKKEDGILAFHGYQSFKPGEVTLELAHEIGIKLAEKLWGDRFEVVVSTHLDRHHLHSHFVLNSVSFVDGKKFNSCRKSYYEMRRASDELCREYGLSVIEKPRKAPSRMQYLAEKNGEMTKYTNVKRDIQECMAMSYSPEKFEQLMEKRRYTMFFIGDELAIDHPFIKSPIRLCDLGEGFSTDEILEFIYNNKHYLKRINLPEQTRVKDIFFDGDVNNSYVTFYDLCGNYIKDTRGNCPTRHYIRSDALEQIVLLELKHLVNFLKHDEERLAEILERKSNKDLYEETRYLEGELQKALARQQKVANLYEKLYEDNAEGKVTDEWFTHMSHKYELERTELKGKISDLRHKLSNAQETSKGKDMFLNAVRSFMEMETLTAPLAKELIDHIDVYEAEGKGKNKTQRIVIYYRFVGYLELPDKIPIVNDTRQGVAVNYISGTLPETA